MQEKSVIFQEEQSTGHAQGHLWLMKAYHPKQANKGRMGRAIEPCTRAKP